MSAARVLNPIVLTEFCKIRPSPSTVKRNLSCGRQLDRIKRDLFGPTNPQEINKTFVEEVKKTQDDAAKKWGFDFRSGIPLQANSQYIWERVSFQENYTPEVYTLTRAAHQRPVPVSPTSMDLLMDERAERSTLFGNLSATSTDDETHDESESCDDSHDEEMNAIFKVPPTLKRKNYLIYQTPQQQQLQRKRQPKITEYMKERKRLAQTPKKFPSSSPPAKRIRTNSGGTVAGGNHHHHHHHQNSNTQPQAHLISSHFLMRK